MFKRFLLCFLSMMLLGAGMAQMPVAPQVEQYRQFTSPIGTPALNQQTAPAGENLENASTSDDAFGAQVILKRQEKPQPFDAYAEVGEFFTSNAALVKEDPMEDSFFVSTVGASFTQRFGLNVRFDVSAQVSVFRYDRFSGLDFQSIDVSTGLTWTPPKLHGAEIFLRYGFTDLTTATNGDEFYNEESILLGMQRVVPFTRAQAFYLGASGQWSFADPAPSGCDQYTAYIGYRAQLARRLNLDLSYRYGFYVYRQDEGREDQNHTVSLALRYTPYDWLTFSASTFLAADRSNRSAFSYNVANAGIGLQVSWQF